MDGGLIHWHLALSLKNLCGLGGEICGDVSHRPAGYHTTNSKGAEFDGS